MSELFFCEQCKDKNLRSTVIAKSREFCKNSSIMFWDEAGKKHIHPGLKVVVSYSCSNGHKFKQTNFSGCWCGWTNE